MNIVAVADPIAFAAKLAESAEDGMKIGKINDNPLVKSQRPLKLNLNRSLIFHLPHIHP